MKKIMWTRQTSYNSTDDMVMIERSGWIITALFVSILAHVQMLFQRLFIYSIT